MDEKFFTTNKKSTLAGIWKQTLLSTKINDDIYGNDLELMLKVTKILQLNLLSMQDFK